jgi:Putative zinc-finger
MADNLQNGMRHGEFEALLTDALDGTLDAATQARFAAHREACDACGLMFREAEAGMAALAGIAELEPPAHLLHRILDATSADQQPARESLAARLRGGIRGLFAPVLQPRFAMSCAMAFFSVSMLLNLAGVQLRHVTLADLSPSTLTNRTVQTYYEAQARVVKYYENLRLVYEIESRVRDLKSNAPAEEPPKNDNNKNKKNPKDDNTSGHPERKNEQYVQFYGTTVATLDCRTAELPNCRIENAGTVVQLTPTQFDNSAVRKFGSQMRRQA